MGPARAHVFDDPHSDFEALLHARPGQRRLLAVAHTYSVTGPNNARARIISVREATRHERRQYEDEPR